MDRFRMGAASLITASLFTTACDLPAPSPGWRIAVDSTGTAPVRVVNEPLSDSIPVTARVVPGFRVGGIDVVGPTSFGAIAQLAVDGTGRLAVLDRQAQELRIFDFDGNHLRTFGGEGGGPGELRGAFGVVREGQHLLVPEQRNARVSVFHPDSGFVASYPFHFRSYGAYGWRAEVDTAGRLLVSSSGPAPGGGGGQNVLRVYDDEMNPVDTVPVGSYDDELSAMYRISLGGGASTVRAVPFHGRRYRALDDAGHYWHVDAGQAYRLKRFEPGGDTVRIVEVRRPPEPVQAAERDSALDAIRSALRERGVSPDVNASRIPDVHAPVHGLTLAENGDVWVRISPPERAPTVYDVLDETGRVRETVRVPGRVHGFIDPVIRGDRFWAVVIDDLDVQYLLGGRLEDAEPGLSRER